MPRQQRLPPPRRALLRQLTSRKRDIRNDALYAAYRTGAMTMTELADRCGLSVSRVSRLIAQAEGTLKASQDHGAATQ